MLSVATMQEWLKITGDADVLERIEAGVVRMLEEATGRLFTSPAATLVDILDGTETDGGSLSVLYTPADFVVLREEPNGGTITSIEFRSSGTWTAQDVADYELSGRQLFRANGSNFPAGNRNIRVTYPFGFAVDEGPADAVLVALELVKHIYERRDAGIIASAGIGPMRITYASAAAAGFADKIEALRRPCLPA